MTMQDAERLTQAFYEWEIAGRGWHVHPYRVSLEPPFRPFVRPVREARPLDDTRKLSALGRLSRWLRAGDSKQAGSALPQTIDALRAPEPERTEALVELDVLVPADLTVDLAPTLQWLHGLAGSRGSVAFEVIGCGGRVTVRIACESGDARRLIEQSKAFLGGISLRDAAAGLNELWSVADPDVLGGIEFGLAREFMLPLPDRIRQTSVLSAILAAMGHLAKEDIAVFQVLFAGATAPWNEHAIRAVTTVSGDAFFADAPEVTVLAREKCAEPFAVAAIRFVVGTQRRDVAEDVLLDVAHAMSTFDDQTRNALTPLAPFDLDVVLDDVLHRTTHRHGFLVSLRELANFAALPSASIASERLNRTGLKTKAAPTTSRDHRFELGSNEHGGVTVGVGISTEDRLKHCYVVGASGTGKSTLLLNMACRDLECGNGFAVLDPHGDLVDEILARVPDERIEDVVVLDPSDENFPVGFNILAAHSELERTLLASDLVAVFRRLSTTFGDQMEVVLSNAILAFLERPDGGTLVDLRRFLLDKSFREKCLETVRDQEIVSYWRREFPLLRGNPHASILTRLNAFLRPRLIRNIVAQKSSGIDLRAMMDGRKVILARLSQGSIGEESSHLLGSFLVSQFAQAAASRQNQPAEKRAPFFLYIDEFHHFMTPSIASILSGARKYGLGLTLAHQELRQISSRNDDVCSSVLSNAYTRVVFRVSEYDARMLSAGLSFFDASDLQNLGTGQAIARIEGPQADFNLRTPVLKKVTLDQAEIRKAAVIASSRRQFSTPRAIVEARLDQSGDRAGEEEQTPAGVSPAAPTRRGTHAKQAVEPNEKSVPPRPGRGGPQHKYVQSFVSEWARANGFRVEIEHELPAGARVDVFLSREGHTIACEIAASSTVDREIANIEKCLSAGVESVVTVCLDGKFLARLQGAVKERIPEQMHARICLCKPEELVALLSARLPAANEDRVAGYSVSVRYKPQGDLSAQGRRQIIAEVLAKSVKRIRRSDP